MTPAELDLKEELAVGFDKKIQHAKGLVVKVMDLKPLMLAGNVDEVFRCILMDKELMEVCLPFTPLHLCRSMSLCMISRDSSAARLWYRRSGTSISYTQPVVCTVHSKNLSISP